MTEGLLPDAAVRGESQTVRRKVVSATDSSFSRSPPEIRADACPPSLRGPRYLFSPGLSEEDWKPILGFAGLEKGAPQLSLSSHMGLLREIVAVRVYKSSGYRWQNELIMDNRYTSLWITVWGTFCCHSVDNMTEGVHFFALILDVF